MIHTTEAVAPRSSPAGDSRRATNGSQPATSVACMAQRCRAARWRRTIRSSTSKAAVAVTALALMAASCTGARGKALGVAPKPNLAASRVLVTFGASDAQGAGTDNPLREAWPQDLFHLLPGNYRLVNLAISGATLSDALNEGLPTAQMVRPAVAVIWLATNDVLSQVPVATYQAELTTLVGALRAMGTTVLVGNAVPPDALPAYVRCVGTPVASNCPPRVPLPLPPPATVDAMVAAYNSAIATVAAREGAAVVDLYSAAAAAAAQGAGASFVSDDGFNPSAAGAQRIASEFAAVLLKP